MATRFWRTELSPRWKESYRGRSHAGGQRARSRREADTGAEPPHPGRLRPPWPPGRGRSGRGCDAPRPFALPAALRHVVLRGPSGPLVDGVHPAVHLPARFLARLPVPLLDLPDQDLGATLDLIEVVVGQLAPPLLHVTL